VIANNTSPWNCSEDGEGWQVNIPLTLCSVNGSTLFDCGWKGRALWITANVRIVGFTFQGGYASYGGIIQAINSSLSVEACRFQNNVATKQGGAINAQGAIHLSSSFFFNNTARPDSVNGSAIGGAVSIQGELNVSECFFQNNSAIGNIFPALSSNGGAIICFLQSRASIIHSFFGDNSAKGYGGGVSIVLTNPDDVIISVQFNQFLRNSARSGGGLDLSNVLPEGITSSGTLSNLTYQVLYNTFAFNNATGDTVDGLGGGTDGYFQEIKDMQDCTFYLAHNNFSSNFARVRGGGFGWMLNMPTFTPAGLVRNNITLFNNTMTGMLTTCTLL
jgi:predicted outer membrane repeat protein